MYAIVKTGGKQYRVADGDIVAVEKIEGPVGTELALPALLLVDGDDVVTDAEALCVGVAPVARAGRTLLVCHGCVSLT